MLGLLFEMLQLLWYGFGTTTWMMWGAGILASMSSITYPAISAFVSVHSTPDRQGVVQGELLLRPYMGTVLNFFFLRNGYGYAWSVQRSGPSHVRVDFLYVPR